MIPRAPSYLVFAIDSCK